MVRRWAARLLFGLGLLLALVVLVLIVGPRTVFVRELVRQRTLAALGELSDAEVRIGAIRGSFLHTLVIDDLSALVEVPVSQPHVESLPPVPTPDVQTVQLPRTGASHVKDMLLVAFGSMLVGGAMLLGRRRLGAR